MYCIYFVFSDTLFYIMKHTVYQRCSLGQLSRHQLGIQDFDKLHSITTLIRIDPDLATPLKHIHFCVPVISGNRCRIINISMHTITYGNSTYM